MLLQTEIKVVPALQQCRVAIVVARSKRSASYARVVARKVSRKLNEITSKC